MKQDSLDVLLLAAPANVAAMIAIRGMAARLGRQGAVA
jgi:hypothetical protein